MSDSSENTNKNIARRDGMSQSNRLLADLTPENHPIDGRTQADLIKFVHAFADLINFYDTTNSVSGTWQQLLPADMAKKKDRPHLAMVFAFYELFKQVQTHANTLTKRHLDFFYKNFLNYTEKDAIPDQAHLLFELAKNIKKYELEQGTKFRGGKDATGIELIYELEDTIVLNKASASHFKTINNPFHGLRTDPDDITDGKIKVYASPIANSKDGEGEVLDEETPQWYPLGVDQNEDKLDTTEFGMPEAQIGFAIASPVLHLAEGYRYVHLSFQVDLDFNEDLEQLTDDIVAELFTFEFSGAKKWIAADPVKQADASGPSYTKVDKTTGQIDFVLELDPTVKPIVAYDSENLDGGFATEHPVLRAIFRTQYYALLDGLDITNLELTVNVEGVRNLVIQNDLARLNPNKPFMPFGPKPKPKGNFYIGSEEVFYKKLEEFTVKLEWADLPDSFFGHYIDWGKNADDDDDSPTGTRKSNMANDFFKARFELLVDREWLPSSDWAAGLVPQSELFEDNGVTPVPPNKEFTIALNSSLYDDVELDSITGKSPAFGVDSISGFLKMELQSDTFEGPDAPGTAGNWRFPNFTFGHQEYPRLFAKRSVAGVTEDTGDGPVTLPTEPYTPILNAISIDYTATATFTPSADDAAEESFSSETFFHITPFGYKEAEITVPTESSESGLDTHITMVPHYDEEGTLYIGLEDLDLDVSGTVSLLFQMVEGTADTELALDIAEAFGTDSGPVVGPEASEIVNAKDDVRWYYLKKDNQWQEFKSTDVVLDTTNSLKTSGIIKFAMPNDAVDSSTILTDNLYWIKASVEVGAKTVCKVIEIRAQAAVVEFSDNDNDPDHLKDPLKAKSIKKLKNQVSQIKAVTQPYATFGGKVKEQASEFYTRVSERNRHKGRAETYWDYERLVLEEFPSIYKIKCVPHTDAYGEHEPCNVLMVGIPNIKNTNAVNLLEPRNSLNTLQNIQQYLTNVAPRYIDIHVVNPEYEEIYVKFSVKFHDGFDIGFYHAKLDKAIVDFLSPWGTDSEAEISFNGSIHKYAIMNFIEQQEYVNYVFNFQLWYKATGEVEAIETNKVQSEDPRAILVSRESHDITVVTEDPEPEQLGYCSMGIERNFTIVNKSC